jgi:ABC-2 type transport system permease protein
VSTMLRSILAFEARYHLKSMLFWLSGVLFFVLSFGAATTDSVQIGGAIGAVNRNSPFVIMQFSLVMTVIASFVVVAFVAGAILRDEEQGTAGMLFTTPMRKRDYVFGRFAGAFLVACGIMAFVMAAIFVGSLMPWLDAERVGPFIPGAYLYSFFMLSLPTLFFMSAVFLGLATLTRSMMGSYIGLVAFLVGYAIAGTLLADLENETLAVLLDPFGMGAFQVATQYWTTFERNTRILGFDRDILLNRALWIGLGVVILAFTYARFRLTTEARPARGLRWLRRRKERKAAERRARREAEDAAAPTDADEPGHRALPAPTFGTADAWAQLWRQVRFEVRGVVRSVPFIILVILGILNVIGASTVVEQLAGTPVYPVTHLMITVMEGSFLLFTVIILTFYAGELVFRDREKDVDGIHDALPAPNWVFWGGKMAALAVIVLTVLTVGVLTTMGIQLYRGYADFEPGLYALGVGVLIGWPFLLIAVLALAAQVITNQKYVGFLVVLLYFISDPILGAMGWTHNLYQYAQSPPAPYSDMNGYGHFLAPTFWFLAYWSMLAIALLVATHLFWVRGRDTVWGVRLRVARRRFQPGIASVLAIALLGFVGIGGWIFYNTNIVNEYVSPEESLDRLADYERTYSKFASVPQPRITSVYSEVDIYPEERALDIRGAYEVENRTSVPIDSVHLSIAEVLEVRDLRVRGGRPVLVDSVHGYRIYQLDEPLEPGGRTTITFELGVRNPGFVNGTGNTNVVHNGTFISNAEYFPHIGYVEQAELDDPNERRKRDLPPPERMAPQTDSVSLGRTYISGEADWVHFETVVSTSPDQLALAPGYLEREWTENGRRYFHYAMDAPMLPGWAYLSADWAVKKDRWVGPVATGTGPAATDTVEIAIYYHPDHAYNVDRMIDASKKSLDYFTREFGPYQHRQVRILEFPRYARFAQSFPNTIPFSESIGFIARLTDEEAIDYVFYVTAHEIAHQWWAHQVIGANVQGATVLSETMSQYSALMVMEQEYGREKMRRFLRYELDQYLQGRGTERIEEMPLRLVENQGYIHYRKGSLAMYALRDYVGEAALNARIRAYLEAVKFQLPPYTTSTEFLGYLAPAVPREHAHVLEDLFETITLWDLRVDEATIQETDDGRWAVTLALETAKYRATGQGEEQPVPLDDWIDIGVFGEDAEGAPPEGEVLYLEKRRITAETDTVTVVVDTRPVRAGIDPFNKLIDRDPGDNITRVSDG